MNIILQIAVYVYLFTKIRELYLWAGFKIWYHKQKTLTPIDRCDGVWNPIIRRSIMYKFRCKIYTLLSIETINGSAKKWNCATDKFEEI
jgi:hypothetical protein